LRPFSISRFCPQLFALLVLAASLVASCVTAFSAEVGLAWDASTSPEVLGYKIYYGLVNDVRVIDVGNVTTYRVKGLEPDTYWFCVTAYDLSGNETGCSNVVSITLSPPMYGFRVESASSLPQVWRNASDPRQGWPLDRRPPCSGSSYSGRNTYPCVRYCIVRALSVHIENFHLRCPLEHTGRQPFLPNSFNLERRASEP